jgi:hypothetical protein
MKDQLDNFNNFLIQFIESVKTFFIINFGLVDAFLKLVFLYFGYLGGTAYLDKTTSIMHLIGYYSLFIWVNALVLVIMVFMAVITGNYR